MRIGWAVKGVSSSGSATLRRGWRPGQGGELEGAAGDFREVFREGSRGPAPRGAGVIGSSWRRQRLKGCRLTPEHPGSPAFPGAGLLRRCSSGARASRLEARFQTRCRPLFGLSPGRDLGGPWSKHDEGPAARGPAQLLLQHALLVLGLV